MFSFENLSLGYFPFSSGMGKTKTTLSHRTKSNVSLVVSLIRFFSNEEKKDVMPSISYFPTIKTKLDRDKLIFPEEKISAPLAQQSC